MARVIPDYLFDWVLSLLKQHGSLQTVKEFHEEAIEVEETSVDEAFDIDTKPNEKKCWVRKEEE